MHPGHAHPGRARFASGQRHRRHAQAAAHKRHRTRTGYQIEGVPKRAEAADRVARRHRQQLSGAGANRLEDHFDSIAFGPVDREGAPQQRAWRPAEVDELAGANRLRDLRRIER